MHYILALIGCKNVQANICKIFKNPPLTKNI